MGLFFILKMVKITLEGCAKVVKLNHLRQLLLLGIMAGCEGSAPAA